MKRVLIKEINSCAECPYFKSVNKNDGWAWCSYMKELQPELVIRPVFFREMDKPAHEYLFDFCRLPVLEE